MTTTTRKTTKYSSFFPEERLPNWIKPSIGNASQLEKVQKLVKENRLHTICEEGRCPNRGECYAAGTATFLLGGSICTRSCAFCQVEKGKSPEKVNASEAVKVAKAVHALNLKYVVLTAVARDDLPDHGASLFTVSRLWFKQIGLAERTNLRRSFCFSLLFLLFPPQKSGVRTSINIPGLIDLIALMVVVKRVAP